KKESPMTISTKSVTAYQGKIWVTRKKPFIDRMASAWLIKRFIDKSASFDFIDEKDAVAVGRDAIVFDLSDGEFTHKGDLCTFEVLLRSFSLKDKTLRKLGELVHVLDIKDEKYRIPEARGVEEILTGIRKRAVDDRDALEKGMTVFEMLYASKTM
ncbi:MAG: chromate resistance protein, partial [Nitrospirae bacterium]|nr:chromate resistance protein [Nitrospirota bacterium]